jgi:hypothetical protein
LQDGDVKSRAHLHTSLPCNNNQFDAENRLVEVKKNNVSMATFVYDGDGQRVKTWRILYAAWLKFQPQPL